MSLQDVNKGVIRRKISAIGVLMRRISLPLFDTIHSGVIRCSMALADNERRLSPVFEKRRKEVSQC